MDDNAEPQISFRLPPEEFRALTRAAEASGLKTSVWARLILRHAAGMGGNFADELKRAQERAPWSVRLDS